LRPPPCAAAPAGHGYGSHHSVQGTRPALERQKLLHLHYAEAVPIDLFKQEQKRITSELDAARQQLADVSVEFDAIEQNLKMAPKLARNCYAA
jgi:hypothetical protein